MADSSPYRAFLVHGVLFVDGALFVLGTIIIHGALFINGGIGFVKGTIVIVVLQGFAEAVQRQCHGEFG